MFGKGVWETRLRSDVPKRATKRATNKTRLPNFQWGAVWDALTFAAAT
jgi:hypothetical protein